MRKIKRTVTVFLIVALMVAFKLPVVSATEVGDENSLFEAYRKSFDSVHLEEDIAQNGFIIAETQVAIVDETDQVLTEEEIGLIDAEIQEAMPGEADQVLAVEENGLLDAETQLVMADETDQVFAGEENGVLDTETQEAMADETDQIFVGEDIAQNGFITAKTQDAMADETDQVFTEEDDEQASAQIMLMIDHAVLGKLKALPAIHQDYHRLALFFVSEDGSVVAKTDDFFSNTWLKGQIRQTNRDIISLSYADLNGDGLDDIIIISACNNDFGIYADKTYQVADVLFQDQKGFYRDPRISDKLNRFDMNKTDQAVIAFVRDGISMEFLFTAKNLDELLAKGFKPINSQCFTEHFEKFGVVDIVSGFFNMAGQNYLMVYIVDRDGRILWNFQPMHYYVNFYAISAISFRDIDGDGNKDLLLIGRYVTYNEDRKAVIKKDYDIYYQRAGYFLEDIKFKQSYYCQEDDTISTITKLARQYWGWPQ